MRKVVESLWIHLHFIGTHTLKRKEKQDVVFNSRTQGHSTVPCVQSLYLTPKETRFTGRVLLYFQYEPDTGHREMSQLIHCVVNETFSMMMH